MIADGIIDRKMNEANRKFTFLKKKGRPLGPGTPKTPLAKRLQHLQKNESIAAFSRKMKISNGAAHSWLVGDTEPKLSQGVSIIEKYGVTPYWLLGLEEPQRSTSMRFLRVIGYAAADESGGRFEVEQDQGDPRELPIPSRAELVKVVGNSMSPVVLAGQYVLIDREANVNPGDLAVVEVKTGLNSGVYVKRIHWHNADAILSSVNVSEMIPPIVVPRGDLEAWKVVGVLFR